MPCMHACHAATLDCFPASNDKHVLIHMQTSQRTDLQKEKNIILIFLQPYIHFTTNEKTKLFQNIFSSSFALCSLTTYVHCIHCFHVHM
jgi:hypothetical protein